MSSVAKYLFCIAYITYSITASGDNTTTVSNVTNEEGQCLSNPTDTKELKMQKAEVKRLEGVIEAKDKQIEYLLEKLQERSDPVELSDGADDSRSCAYVRPDLHFKNEQGVDQCIHECIDYHSCSDAIISCYPYESCIVNCKGHGACNNLVVEYIAGPATLNCVGFQSCIGVAFQPLNYYEFEGTPPRGHLRKYEPPENLTDFEWYLPNITLTRVQSEKFVINENNTEISPHFVLARNVLPKKVLTQIKDSYYRCNDEEHSEHREFGAGVYHDIEGHTVTYLDDCIDDAVYEFAQSVTHGMLDFLQKKFLEDLKAANISNNDTAKIKEFISEHWMYDWQHFISMANGFDSRVIEYIRYSDSGNLGWHTDDDSNITMVTQLNDEDTFDGGLLRFRLNPWDITEYHVRLGKYDAILFPSYSDHAVEPVTDGVRDVMVFEWWDIGRSVEIGRVDPMDHMETMAEMKRSAAK